MKSKNDFLELRNMNLTSKIFLPVITGITASGKSALAIALVEKFSKEGIQSEIVCCDSMLVYKGMDIGTAKPSPSIQKQIQHHCLDLVNPDETFDAGHYVKEAKKGINQIISRGNLPLLIGGSGLYLRALTKGLLELPFDNQEQLKQIRTRLKNEIENKNGKAVLRQRLQKIDPEALSIIHPNDNYRLIRQLEVFELTGKPLRQLQANHAFRDSPYEIKMVALKWPRKKIYQRINARLDQMVNEGLEKEVKNLLENGISPQAKPLKTFAYRYFVKNHLGECTKEQAISLSKRDSRHFAKRQATWFRPLKDLYWLQGDQDLKNLTYEVFKLFKSSLHH